MNSKKILAGAVVLVLIGGAIVYYVGLREEKKWDADPSPSTIDSTTSNHEVGTTEIGVKPEKNPEDGSVKIVEEFVKANAKNPSSFEFLEWSDISLEEGYWKVRCKYRGISSFNAEVTTNAWFYIKSNKVVYTKVISKI